MVMAEKVSEDARKLAKLELREDDNTRENALKMMREWIMQNPRIIHCRTDDSFLLRFLRTKKFSIPMAQEAMERYLLLRQSMALGFHNLDYTLPNMDFLLKGGYMFAAPGRDKLGRRWIIYRPGVFDPYRFHREDMLRIHGIVYEYLMEDEENQIRGFVHFADGSGVSLPYLTLFTPKEAVRIVKNGERTLPMRHKEVYGINVHPSVKYALDFGMALISQKIRERVKVFTNLDNALKVMDPSMLPKEYGGEMPMDEMIDKFMKELGTMRDQILAHDDMKVRLELFSENARNGAVSALKGTCSRYADSPDPLSGSFRKLQVD